MSELTSFRAVVELWPSREAMASELGAGTWAVSKWWQRDSIPAEYWSAILASDRVAGVGLTAQMMADWFARAPVEQTAEPLEARP